MLQGCVISNSASKSPWRLKELLRQARCLSRTRVRKKSSTCLDLLLGVDQVELVLRTLLLSLRRLQLRLRLPEALLEAKGVRLDSFSKQLVVLLLLEFLPLLLRVQERTFKASFWRCLGNRTRRPWKCCVSKA